MKGTYEDVSMFNKDMEYVLPESSKPKAFFLSKRIEEEEDDDGDEEEQEEEVDDDEDDDEEEDRFEDKELTIERLKISKLINNPMDLLLGPPQHNMQNAEYLVLISDLTNTQCRLEGREIVIEGYNKDLVQEALERFEIIQKTFVKTKKKEGEKQGLNCYIRLDAISSAWLCLVFITQESLILISCIFVQ